ncbi:MULTISPECIES: polyprenyl synthetase family protein [unclassified Planococcus (in: firmicutes)]|uniref:polyprenyl synthetase family protein n=1 Tax=unclassified Planococcus (in: firmicutes) TaxID=2662419 RepID=UPI000C34B5C3|nr:MULTISPECIES: farnesyl diphosphate synthase [unclassified Planococcus (in: firmicutes)]AUD13796.1 farnesyl-diphosphate synthase [Planococcus sp. MB-3u-03]PKG45718.1 farnesyl-diphosphate synthase [Planococcus sp. Urea-trap-24]PKG88572.1 farnesyl-diphosphate synthase [Planococcus sp. Urea-3u-39]PKH38709.1 farnesyl-diphosphate synthase [Planococcus sp. MB-3u-09]
MNLKQFRTHYEPVIQQEMAELISELAIPESLKESMHYSLQAGGKRIRPMLVLATMHEQGAAHPDALKVAAAIEMIHTYSLIHDDLPSMDNDDLRRGMPTNHKVFGEAVAILAGDALLTFSFGILARLDDVSAEDKVRLIDLLSTAAGAEGMVGGQVLDIEGEEKQLGLEQLEQVHLLKTGALLTYSIISGAILAGASSDQLVALSRFGRHLGLAFQIQDDILDVTGTSEELGKTAGKDETSDKSTYPGILTLPKAKEKLDYHAQQALDALAELPGEQQLLKELTELIVQRKS